MSELAVAAADRPSRGGAAAYGAGFGTALLSLGGLGPASGTVWPKYGGLPAADVSVYAAECLRRGFGFGGQPVFGTGTHTDSFFPADDSGMPVVSASLAGCNGQRGRAACLPPVAAAAGKPCPVLLIFPKR